MTDSAPLPTLQRQCEAAHCLYPDCLRPAPGTPSYRVDDPWESICVKARPAAAQLRIVQENQ